MIGVSRNPYHVLEAMPTVAIFYFYCGSVIIGLWHILKLTIQFLWNWIMQIRTIKSDKTIMDAYGSGYHDKPPQCLVENGPLGRQLYVKLKVTNNTHKKLLSKLLCSRKRYRIITTIFSEYF